MRISVLVTGASGFIGKKILKRLSTEHDLEVSGLVRDAGRIADIDTRNIRIYEGDLLRPSSLTEAACGKEVIIHCAALMSNFDAEPRSKFREVNVVGTENLLKACDRGSLKQFMHISTAGVYGSTGAEPADENHLYGEFLSDYEWSKKNAEISVLSYCKEHGMPYTILRPSQVYGAGMAYGWTETIDSIRKGKMLIPGNGAARIHLLHVNDFVEAVVRILNNPNAIRKIYNIAGPEPMPMGSVFDLIAEHLRAKMPFRCPYMPVYAASIILSVVPYALKGRALRLLTPHRVRFFAEEHIYDQSRVINEIGFRSSIYVRDGFKEMIDFLAKKEKL